MESGDSQDERALEREVRLDMLVDLVTEYAIFLISPENTLRSWNPGVARVLGYERDEFIGRPAEMLFVPEDVAEGVPRLELEVAERTGQAMDDRWQLRKDGRRFWANGVVTVARSDGGEVLGFVKVMRDNTAQKQAQEALERARAELERRVEERTAELSAALEELRKSEARFSQIFRAGPFAAAVTQLADDRFVDVNDAFVALTGYAREEVLGRTAAELGMWSSEEDRLKQQDAARDEGFRNLELGVRTKQGDVRTVVASGVVIQLNGHQGRLKTFYDITDRKRSEEELMQAIQDVMRDASWFSRSVVERLAEIRSGNVDNARVAELTRRERQVLERVARGLSNADIAAELGIAAQTVRNYITSVYEKIGARSRVEAVVWARERGLGI